MKYYKHLEKLQDKLINLYNERNGIERNRHLLGAIALDNHGRIISYGFNSYNKTHPHQAKFAIRLNKPDKVFLHAEISCMIKADKKIETLIVTRLNRSKKCCMAEPCPVCKLAIKEAGIENVYYTNYSGNLILMK